jgi:predicted acetyltransferase
MPRLVEPTPTLYVAWKQAHLEWGPGVHEDGFGLRRNDDTSTAEAFAGWVDRLRSDPGQLWWILDGDAVADGIALRSEADPAVQRHGHIGYGVRPSFRGRGLATWALREVMHEAAARGLRQVLLVCAPDNAGSVRVIERVGGQLERQSSPVAVNRYWVDLPRLNWA